MLVCVPVRLTNRCKNIEANDISPMFVVCIPVGKSHLKRKILKADHR